MSLSDDLRSNIENEVVVSDLVSDSKSQKKYKALDPYQK